MSHKTKKGYFANILNLMNEILLNIQTIQRIRHSFCILVKGYEIDAVSQMIITSIFCKFLGTWCINFHAFSSDEELFHVSCSASASNRL